MDADPAGTPPCVVMTLPDDLLIPAARTAVEVFPANALPALAEAILPPQSIAVLTSKYFGPKPRVLSVSSLDGASPALMRRIVSHANSWDCGVTFAWTEGQGDVRITRSGNSCASYLGTDILMIPPGQPTMWLGQFTERTSEAEFRRIVRHEVGHTLGFPHEHLRRAFVERIDRAKAYAYFLRWQGWGKDLVDVNVLTPVEEKSLMASPPDAVSIMTYPLPGEIMVDGGPIPGGEDLDASDLAFADSIYPVEKKGPTPPVTPPTEPPPPPVEPPEPTEEFGPYDLRLGDESDRFTMLPGAAVLFRFKARRRAAYVAATRGKTPLRMDLLDAKRRIIDSDDAASGVGPNALVARALDKGIHFLRVRGMTPEDRGPFRVKVDAP